MAIRFNSQKDLDHFGRPFLFIFIAVMYGGFGMDGNTNTILALKVIRASILLFYCNQFFFDIQRFFSDKDIFSVRKFKFNRFFLFMPKTSEERYETIKRMFDQWQNSGGTFLSWNFLGVIIISFMSNISNIIVFIIIFSTPVPFFEGQLQPDLFNWLVSIVG